SLRLSADFRRIASSLLLQILQYLSSSLLALLGTRRKYSVRKPFVALGRRGSAMDRRRTMDLRSPVAGAGTAHARQQLMLKGR
ncbi:MAG TPA: hypothetical protein VM925_15760, partial [Labilithrix sp.]|nr:hypothetical protein [Labilithrix sp.]